MRVILSAQNQAPPRFPELQGKGSNQDIPLPHQLAHHLYTCTDLVQLGKSYHSRYQSRARRRHHHLFWRLRSSSNPWGHSLDRHSQSHSGFASLRQRYLRTKVITTYPLKIKSYLCYSLTSPQSPRNTHVCQSLSHARGAQWVYLRRPLLTNY